MDSNTQVQILKALECSCTQSDELKKCALKQIAQADFCPSPNIVAASLQAFRGEEAESEFELATAAESIWRKGIAKKIDDLRSSKNENQLSFTQFNDELKGLKRLPSVLSLYVDGEIEHYKSDRFPEIAADEAAVFGEAIAYPEKSTEDQVAPIWVKDSPSEEDEEVQDAKDDTERAYRALKIFVLLSCAVWGTIFFLHVVGAFVDWANISFPERETNFSKYILEHRKESETESSNSKSK